MSLLFVIVELGFSLTCIPRILAKEGVVLATDNKVWKNTKNGKEGIGRRNMTKTAPGKQRSWQNMGYDGNFFFYSCHNFVFGMVK